MRRLFAALLFFSFSFGNALAQGYYRWTPTLEKAYREATSLQLESAAATIAQAEKTEPNNLLALHVANYVDFFRVYIDEEETAFKRLEKNRDRRLARIEKEGDRRSPWHRFLLADIRLQWALARLKFEEYTSAFIETNKAFKLLTENEQLFPDFLPTKKDLGILHAMAGTIPGNYQWLMRWFSSLEGTIEQGRNELEEILDYAAVHPFIYEQEVYIYYAYLQLHLNNDEKRAWEVIRLSRLEPAENPLHCFVAANVAMRTGRGEMAMHYLENRPSLPGQHPFYYLDYLMGLAKLQSLSLDAERYFLRYVTLYRGRNFIKDAWQKIAWCRLLQGNLIGYHTAMQECLQQGGLVVDSDKSAYREALSGELPTGDLLRSRLLFDGGYFQEAWIMLNDRNGDSYISDKNQLEFTYRKGRTAQALGYREEAIRLFNATIAKGENKPWYFACRAALELGHIYEGQKAAEAARTAYQTCLRIKPEEHRTGLHQQAKAGLRRLE